MFFISILEIGYVVERSVFFYETQGFASDPLCRAMDAIVRAHTESLLKEHWYDTIGIDVQFGNENVKVFLADRIMVCL